jgi:myo-inositol 2-dehydrogenase/D-chiro-inositol 1-dehydrogenase
MVRIAVLGCGRIGRMHAANIAAHPRAALGGVFDIHRPSAEEVASTLDAPLFDSAEAVFASPDVDAVLVATATPTHADYIEQAVASGKPVLCEKPIDLSLARVNACAEAIRGKDPVIQLGFNRRFDPGHRAARDAVRAGQIGDLHQVVITSRDPGMPPRTYYEAAGGLFRDMTIHDFDLARFMLDEEPEEVFAIGGRMIDPELMNELDDFDSGMIILRTASGKMCHINNSRTAVYGYDQRVELLGTTGMLISGNRKPQEVTHYSADHTERAAPYQFFFIERYREAFDAEIGAFVEAVEKGVAPEVGFEDGRRALMLAEAAMKSAAEGRAVRMSEIG